MYPNNKYKNICKKFVKITNITYVSIYLPMTNHTSNNYYVCNHITKHNECANNSNSIRFAVISTCFFSKGFCPNTP